MSWCKILTMIGVASFSFFVGSGLSFRYLQLPTWNKLLEKLTLKLKLSKPFNYYSSSCDGDPMKIAEKLADELHEIWWTEKRFKASRDKYQDKIFTKQDCLKCEVVELLSELVDYSDQYEEELTLLRNIKINGIITTNWDNFFEETFPEFNVSIGQEQMILSDRFMVGEIFKIHGSINNPSSLILTKSDYNNFNERNPYLAAKLLTTFIEHPIVFLGYSLNDSNIQEILKSITICLQKENVDSLQKKMIFISRAKGNAESISETTLTIEEFTIPIVKVVTDDFSSIYRSLGDLKRTLPIKLLRHIQEMVVNVVRTKSTTNKIYVTDDNIDYSKIQDYEMILGLSLKEKLGHKGIVGITQKDLVADVINPSITDSLNIVKEAFPHLKKGNGKFFPIYKYLNDLNMITKGGKLKKSALDVLNENNWNELNDRDRSFWYPGMSYSKWKNETNTKYKCIEDIEQEDETIDRKMIRILLLDDKKINVDSLEKFIHLHDSTKNHSNTYFKKVVCLYDYLKYKIMK